jgi:hypothetical protein
LEKKAKKKVADEKKLVQSGKFSSDRRQFAEFFFSKKFVK